MAKAGEVVDISSPSDPTIRDLVTNTNDPDLVIDEGIGNSPETLGPISPGNQQLDDSSSESNGQGLNSFLDPTTDNTDIAGEVEIETSPISPTETLADNKQPSSPLQDDDSADEISKSVANILRTAAKYEDISDDEESRASFDDDRFTTELVSLLTPESTLIEEDSGNCTASSPTSSSSVTSSVANHLLRRMPPPPIRSIPVSTIRWAPRPDTEQLLICHEKMDMTDDVDVSIQIDDRPVVDDDEEVIFLGEFPGKPAPPVQCFLPCCQNAMVKIPAPIQIYNHPHPIHSRYTVHTSSAEPRLFPEPPESEWVLTSVYHLNPLDGILRYKCRSCDDGIVEQKSFRSRFQLYTQQLTHQCPRCEKKYYTKKQLQLHQFRHRERRLPCPFCERRFLTKSELQNHINTHTQKKSFGCPVCSAAFAHSSRYYSHIRTVHKKYDCQECFLKVCGERDLGGPSSST